VRGGSEDNSQPKGRGGRADPRTLGRGELPRVYQAPADLGKLSFTRISKEKKTPSMWWGGTAVHPIRGGTKKTDGSWPKERCKMDHAGNEKEKGRRPTKRNETKRGNEFPCFPARPLEKRADKGEARNLKNWKNRSENTPPAVSAWSGPTELSKTKEIGGMGEGGRRGMQKVTRNCPAALPYPSKEKAFLRKPRGSRRL